MEGEQLCHWAEKLKPEPLDKSEGEQMALERGYYNLRAWASKSSLQMTSLGVLVKVSQCPLFNFCGFGGQDALCASVRITFLYDSTIFSFKLPIIT